MCRRLWKGLWVKLSDIHGWKYVYSKSLSGDCWYFPPTTSKVNKFSISNIEYFDGARNAYYHLLDYPALTLFWDQSSEPEGGKCLRDLASAHGWTISPKDASVTSTSVDIVFSGTSYEKCSQIFGMFSGFGGNRLVYPVHGIHRFNSVTNFRNYIHR